jgi:VIT1/CCC1 family predicted Fe2+/Mn2+ transporter
VVIPFFFFQDAQLALRISNAIAVVLLFACGYLLGQIIGGRSWITGGAMIVLGCALVAVAAALGG